jgi:hypothetical protein
MASRQFAPIYSWQLGGCGVGSSILIRQSLCLKEFTTCCACEGSQPTQWRAGIVVSFAAGNLAQCARRNCAKVTMIGPDSDTAREGFSLKINEDEEVD